MKVVCVYNLEISIRSERHVFEKTFAETEYFTELYMGMPNLANPLPIGTKLMFEHDFDDETDTLEFSVEEVICWPMKYPDTVYLSLKLDASTGGYDCFESFLRKNMLPILFAVNA